MSLFFVYPVFHCNSIVKKMLPKVGGGVQKKEKKGGSRVWPYRGGLSIEWGFKLSVNYGLSCLANLSILDTQYCQGILQKNKSLKMSAFFEKCWRSCDNQFTTKLFQKIWIFKITIFGANMDNCSTHFKNLFSFYNPWKHSKTFDFLMFSGGTEKDQLHEIG